MSCRCGLGIWELGKLCISYCTTSYGKLYCFKCFTCSNCGARGSEIGGVATILKTVPVLCTNCCFCPCGETSKSYAYVERNSKRHYFCSFDCEAFYPMQYKFFLFIFALKEQGVYRLFRHLLPKIFHEVKQMPKYRCVDCWKEFYYSKPLCADCGSTNCRAMLILKQERQMNRMRPFSLFFGDLFWNFSSSWDFCTTNVRTNGNICICDACEIQRPMPRCAFVLRTEDEHCRFVSNIQNRNHALKNPKKQENRNPKKVSKANRSEPNKVARNDQKNRGFVPKKQNRGKMGNFKKKHR